MSQNEDEVLVKIAAVACAIGARWMRNQVNPDALASGNSEVIKTAKEFESFFLSTGVHSRASQAVGKAIERAVDPTGPIRGNRSSHI